MSDSRSPVPCARSRCGWKAPIKPDRERQRRGLEDRGLARVMGRGVRGMPLDAKKKRGALTELDRLYAASLAPRHRPQSLPQALNALVVIARDGGRRAGQR